jgi:hypothetical protein
MLDLHKPKVTKLKSYIHFKREPFSPFLTITRRNGTKFEVDFYEEDMEDVLLREGVPEKDISKISSYATEFYEVYYKPVTGEVHAP